VDFTAGKAGPAFISESLDRGRPVMVLNDKVMPQERPNLDELDRLGGGLGFRMESLVEDTQSMLLQLDQFKRNIQKLPKNNATSEIVSVVDTILASPPLTLANVNLLSRRRNNLQVRSALFARRAKAATRLLLS